MEKKMFDLKTKTIVATGLGAALFIVLFMYVKIPTGIPETDIKTAYGVGAFFSALFGPFLGGFASDMSGSYTITTIYFGLFLIIAAVLAVLLKRPEADKTHQER